MTDAPDKPKSSAALRLLHGVALELCDLAEDTLQFGETLSSDAAIASSKDTIGLLQKFDAFSQSLRAHALLIDGLTETIDGDADNISALHDLIGNIPFFGIRQRLKAKLCGIDEQPDEAEEETWGEHWF